MTPEEIARFALVLSEADRVRAMIAEDEADENEKDSSAREVYLSAAA